MRSLRSLFAAAAATLAFAAPATAEATTRYVSPSGSDAASCTQIAPCASFNRAYNVSSPGDDVEVSGSLPGQTITAASKSSGPNIVFHSPLGGPRATVANIKVENGSFMTFRDLTVTGSVRATEDSSTTPIRSIAYENVRAETVKAYGNVDGFTVSGSEFGDTVDFQPQLNTYSGGASSIRPRNVLIEGNYFHDFRGTPGAHTECFQILRADFVTIRNNRFERCEATGDIGITDGPSSNITIENNWFGEGSFGAQITRNVSNLVVRNNSGVKSIFFSDTGTLGPYTISGNYLPFNGSLCGRANTTYSYNVFAGGTCGPTDRNVSALKFADAVGHLDPASEAIDFQLTGFPDADLDGDARPQGSAADAGRDEVAVAPTPTPTPSPTPTETPTPSPTPTETPTPSPTPTETPTPSPTPTPGC